MSTDRPRQDEGRARRAQWSLVGITLALTVAVVAYRLTHRAGLSQTGAFFVGLPAVLAISVALAPRAKTVTGMTFKAVTFGLLLSGVVLGEGFVCIVMAAPLFYLVAIPIAAFIQRRRARGSPPGQTYALVVLPVLVLSVEGVFDATTLPVRNRVAATGVVAATPAAVEAALASRPAFVKPLPGFLRDGGFPRPLTAEGSGLHVGAGRHILFSGPDGPAPLDLRVVERDVNRVVFGVEHDETAMAGWLSLRRAVVTWWATGETSTRVRWELEFDRALSPAFYFAPLERYAARLAAGYLIRTVATPHG
ncbi:MAG TPA: hypothetical protein VHF27_05615 [Acidimicrobiales bacterium]|nr:hypothetical protein [Acidimicrobiales bacterium]